MCMGVLVRSLSVTSRSWSVTYRPFWARAWMTALCPSRGLTASLRRIRLPARQYSSADWSRQATGGFRCSWLYWSLYKGSTSSSGTASEGREETEKETGIGVRAGFEHLPSCSCIIDGEAMQAIKEATLLFLDFLQPLLLLLWHQYSTV